MKLFLQTMALFVSLFEADLASAAGYIAEVVNLRGVATQLAPGAMMARQIKLGEKLYEDTSIVTHEKSFVRLKYRDGSNMSLGPSGKAVLVEYRGKESNIVSLLKGKLRAKVNEERGVMPENKFFVKTKTAALGVRGTDFQTIYNPENQLTSLVTYKGEVALAKTEASSSIRKEKETDIPDQQNRISEGASSKDLSVSEDPTKEDLEKALSKNSVVVPAGQYSGVVGGLEKPTVPVLINPVQLNALYKNDELIERRSVKDVKPSELNAVASEGDLKVAKQSAPPEGFFDQKNGIYAPKSGGLIDLETGIYVQPGKDSKLDEKRGVYISKDEGKVDKETGQYIPPEGLKLDANKGFVVKNENGEKPKEVLLAMTKQLNTAIASDIVLTNVMVEPIFVLPTNRDLFRRNALSLSFGGGGETLDASGDPTYGSKKYKSSSASEYNLFWEHQSPADYQFTTRFANRNVEYEKSADGVPVTEGSSSLLSMGVGFKYFLSLKSSLFFEALYEQRHFVRYEDDEGSAQMLKTNIPLFKLSYIHRFFEGKRSYFLGEYGGILSYDKELKDVKIKQGYGYFLKLGWNYFIGNDYFAQFNFNFENQSQKVEMEGHNNNLSRNTTGFGLTLGTLF